MLWSQASKLIASPQELGGSMLFDLRYGFNGTPSDLLRLQFGSAVKAAVATLGLAIFNSQLSKKQVRGWLEDGTRLDRQLLQRDCQAV